LAAGLRDNSRIKLLAAGIPVEQDTLLLASIADRLAALLYMFGGDKKDDPPASVVSILLGEAEEKDNVGFESAEAFEAALARIRGN